MKPMIDYENMPNTPENRAFFDEAIAKQKIYIENAKFDGTNERTLEGMEDDLKILKYQRKVVIGNNG